MGKRGPKPAPTAVLAQRGSWRAKERDGEPEAPVLQVAPACPKGLTGDAATIWKEAAPTMVGMGTLTAEDLRTFERYCRAYALWVKKAEQLDKADEITETDAKTLSQLDNTLRRLEAVFGKTPADRAGLKLSPQEKPDAKDPFRKPKLRAV